MIFRLPETVHGYILLSCNICVIYLVVVNYVLV